MKEPITLEQLRNASADAESLDIAINGDENTDVISRKGRRYPTLAKVLKLLKSAAAKQLGRVSSIAELRNYDTQINGARIVVDAYYANGKTGGGEFIADLSDTSTLDDGGVCIVSTNGVRWKRITSATVSAYDFGAVGDGVADDTAAIQAAVNSAAVVRFPVGNYKVRSTVNITSPVSLIGDSGATLVCGANLAKGGNAFVVDASNVSFSGLSFEADVRVSFIRALPTANRQNLFVENCRFLNGFYAVRLGLVVAGTFRISGIRVHNCVSQASSGQNASHFVSSDSDFVSYYGNQTFGGQNAAAYGAYNCTNISIIGNTESGMADIVVGADAGIQIENSSIANISGNTVSHDIWLDDSSFCTVTGNSCRRMRLTVSESGGVYTNNIYSGNNAGRIQITSFGSPPDGAKIGCKFIGNNISSSGVLLNETSISSSIAIDGSFCDVIELIDNRVTSPATTTSFALVRNSNLQLYAKGNDFGSMPNIISASGGVVYENGNKNPLYSSGNGYIRVSLLENLTSPVLNTWKTLTLANEIIDVNSEYSSDGFQPVESGWYEFSGILTFRPGAAGNSLGARLQITSGTPRELVRLCFLRAADGNTVGLPFQTTRLYLKAGNTVELQYFVTGETTSIIAGATVSAMSIQRIF